MAIGVITGLLMLPVSLIDFMYRAIAHCAYGDVCGAYSDLFSGGAMVASVIVSIASGVLAGFGTFHLISFIGQLFRPVR